MLTSYLHDAIPVVARGDLKQGQEGHAKVLKGSVTTHTLTWVVFITDWGRKSEKKKRLVSLNTQHFSSTFHCFQKNCRGKRHFCECPNKPTACYQSSGMWPNTLCLSLSLYPKIIFGMVSRMKKATLASATNPFPSISNRRKCCRGLQLQHTRGMWQFRGNIFQLQCGYFRTVCIRILKGGLIP